MAEIAIELAQALKRRAETGAGGTATARAIAAGEGWSVFDVLCTSGPGDRPFEERHAQVSIAVVAAGTFQYRTSSGSALMTPGSLLLGSPGQEFECGHEHGAGDRCLSFKYAADYFESLSFEPAFRSSRVPPIRATSPLVARALAAMAGRRDMDWEELSVAVATCATQLAAHRLQRSGEVPRGACDRVTHIVRIIDKDPSRKLALRALAREAGLSMYHFLRTFERITGATPYQYVKRARLRTAAMQLARNENKVIDIALDCGFGDVSNFTRAFRTEFGVSPRGFRKQRAEA